MEALLPVLYHRGKGGKLFSYRIWTEGPEIVSEAGSVDGKKITTRKTAKGKNLGRSNETTPAIQATLQAAASWQEKRDRKYSEDPNGIKEELPLPMLASSKKWIDGQKKAVYPAWDQPKLDGGRCLARWEPVGDHGEVVLRSRTGQVWDSLPHINRELEEIMPKGMMLDGEIYLHGVTFQAVVRLIKKQRPESVLISFNCYDILIDQSDPDHTFLERKANLDAFFDGVAASGRNVEHIKKVEGRLVHTHEAVMQVHDEFVALGYEGAVVRNFRGIYEFNFRSVDLIKIKVFEDSEFEVVGFESGEGSYSDCVKWICVTAAGLQFRVNPKGTLPEKREYLLNAHRYVGKQLTVRYFGVTEDNIPRIAVGHGFRDEKDLPVN
jgi:ATP-dependent DNA ligase